MRFSLQSLIWGVRTDSHSGAMADVAELGECVSRSFMSSFCLVLGPSQPLYRPPSRERSLLSSSSSCNNPLCASAPHRASALSAPYIALAEKMGYMKLKKHLIEIGVQ